MSKDNVIDFTAANYVKVEEGKRTTVRLGEKEYSLGEGAFTAEGLPCADKPVITDIRYTHFNKLTLQDALNDGFGSLDQLRQELQLCYGRRVSDFDVVTVVRFEV